MRNVEKIIYKINKLQKEIDNIDIATLLLNDKQYKRYCKKCNKIQTLKQKMYN